MYGTRFAGNRMAGGGGSHVIYGVYGGGASGFRVARGPTSRVLPELRVLVVAVMEVPEVLARLPLPVLRRPVRVVGAGRRRRRRRIPDAVARRRRPVQRRRADAVRRAGRGRVFAPLDRVRVVPGAAPPERKVPLARHLVLFLPLHPTVSVYRVHRAPVPRRFHGAQEFLPAKNHKKTNIKLNPRGFYYSDRPRGVQHFVYPEQTGSRVCGPCRQNEKQRAYVRVRQNHRVFFKLLIFMSLFS